MHMENHSQDNSVVIYQIIFSGPLLLAMVFYLIAVIVSIRLYNKQWPIYRTIFFILGILSASTAVIGPIAENAHFSFVVHMFGHLLLGMISPLLLALAAPMTLVLRTLPVKHARRLTKILRSSPIRILSNPLFTTIFNVGGMWLLYTTNLYMLMQQHILMHILVHIHVFLAGYLFTISMIYIDPTPHRTSFLYRSIVLVLALAAHGTLSKYVYAHPPSGVSVSQAEMGGMLMYYGGDMIELLLIFILCLQWYKATRPRVLLSNSQV